MTVKDKAGLEKFSGTVKKKIHVKVKICCGTLLAFNESIKQQIMKQAANTMKAIFAIIVIALSMNTATAQTNAKSRVAVVANDVKTNIWVSDFPKNASIVIYDGENNLISITTTNNFGAAFLSLTKGVKSGVVVKTIDGEVSASNKSVIKTTKPEQNVVSNFQDEDDTNKA